MTLYQKICNKIYAYLIAGKFRRCGKSYFFSSVKILNHSNISIGNNCLFHDCVSLSAQIRDGCSGYIEIEDDVFVSNGVIISAAYGITIKKGATIGSNSMILDNNHRFDNPDVSVMLQGLSGDKVEIGEYSWIGGNVVVLPGIKIGKAAIIGAGSVVTKSIGDYQIAVGNPARPIGDRRTRRVN